jgi:hypothetical protein
MERTTGTKVNLVSRDDIEHIAQVHLGGDGQETAPKEDEVRRRQRKTRSHSEDLKIEINTQTHTHTYIYIHKYPHTHTHTPEYPHWAL